MKGGKEGGRERQGGGRVCERERAHSRARAQTHSLARERGKRDRLSDGHGQTDRQRDRPTYREEESFV